MSGHTPGPWVQNGTHGHRFIGPVGNEDGCVAIACKVDGRDGWKEMMANALLIAEAPKLLEALEALVEYVDEMHRIGHIQRPVQSSVAVAAIAIARAKGEA